MQIVNCKSLLYFWKNDFGKAFEKSDHLSHGVTVLNRSNNSVFLYLKIY